MSEHRTLILALGNPLRGDDGVGAAILETLAGAESMPPDVTVFDGGTAGLETALLMQGYGRAIIVDAAKMERQPGEWARFTAEEAVLKCGNIHCRGTLHSAGLAEALALGEALDILPPEVVIYGVQPLEVGWAPGLSEPVRAAIPAVCEAILNDLKIEE